MAWAITPQPLNFGWAQHMEIVRWVSERLLVACVQGQPAIVAILTYPDREGD